MSGCGGREEQSPIANLRNAQVVTNDTYIEGRGYYHAPFHAWYPFPYNFYSPGLGYYRGGAYHAQPDLKIQKPTYPGTGLNAPAPTKQENVARGGFTRSGSRSSGWGFRSSGS